MNKKAIKLEQERYKQHLIERIQAGEKMGAGFPLKEKLSWHLAQTHWTTVINFRSYLKGQDK